MQDRLERGGSPIGLNRRRKKEADIAVWGTQPKTVEDQLAACPIFELRSGRSVLLEPVAVNASAEVPSEVPQQPERELYGDAEAAHQHRQEKLKKDAAMAEARWKRAADSKDWDRVVA